MFQRYGKYLMREMSEVGRRTFPWDLARGAASGAVSPLFTTFALLIAIEHFQASSLQKSIIAGSFASGLLLSLPYAAWSPILGRKPVRGALPAFATALAIAAAAFAQGPTSFTIAMAAFGLFGALPLPVMTAIYRDNYRGAVRGQVVGVTIAVSIVFGLATQFLGGGLLELDLAYFRILFLILAVFAMLSGLAILRMPRHAALEAVTPNPFSSFRVVIENPRFGYVLFAWFLLGIANLSMQPQRIEYLTQAQYGIDLSPGLVVLVAGVTIEATRLLTIPVWARLFDRFNFIWLRITMNAFLLGHVVLYYRCQSLPMLILASVSLGVCFGGGALSWTLWVTKFAPPTETGRYMSVHTFMTGVRGAIGPFLGYLLVEHLSIRTASLLAAGFVAISIAMLWRIRNAPRRV